MDERRSGRTYCADRLEIGLGEVHRKMQLSWRTQAACGGVEAALFFPEADDDPALDAKAVCHGCPVRIACLDHALGHGEKAGVWGGTTERERRRILRQRRQTA